MCINSKSVSVGILCFIFSRGSINRSIDPVEQLTTHSLGASLVCVSCCCNSSYDNATRTDWVIEYRAATRNKPVRAERLVGDRHAWGAEESADSTELQAR